MFRIDGNKTIHLTRGDGMSLGITAKYPDGTSYEFGTSTYVRLGIFSVGDFSTCVLQKTILPNYVSETVYIDLTSEETRLGELINQPVTYWYEIQINPDTDYAQTIIGYDQAGPKLFVLYPEGATDENEDIPPEPAAQ